MSSVIVAVYVVYVCLCLFMFVYVYVYVVVVVVAGVVVKTGLVLGRKPKKPEKNLRSKILRSTNYIITGLNPAGYCGGDGDEIDYSLT